MKRKAWLLLALVAVTAFFAWRFLRPMNIFVVDEKFERPIVTAPIPAPLATLRAAECGECHAEFYAEWSTAMHSQAWTDPYFQVDWRFDGQQQICKNCHIPLDRQQEQRVLGFRDADKSDPILAPNPEFDAQLQHEGVTCAACHLREGKILGVYGSVTAPHPVQKLADPNEICVRCHVVSGERWDAFFRFPPCGTVAEIQATPQRASSGELVVAPPAALDCVNCHMPLVERPLVPGGEMRRARQHLWRGGHDPAMVKRGLDVQLRDDSGAAGNTRRVVLIVTNVGAAHYLPTGTPDRHLTVEWRLLDAEGQVLQQQQHTLKRTVLWRPFIIDLWDTRLPRYQPREYVFEFADTGASRPVAVEAVVRYHLLDEHRRKRIAYENTTPISYEVFRQRLVIYPAGQLDAPSSLSVGKAGSQSRQSKCQKSLAQHAMTPGMTHHAARG